VIADLHAHYPMHLRRRLRRQRASTVRALRASDAGLGDRVKALVLYLANRVANFETPFSRPRVTVDRMKEGGVGIALSVLYQPFDELDLSKNYGDPPSSAYFDHLLGQLKQVEGDIGSRKHARDAVFVKTKDELDETIRGDRIAMIHCVEGGFHLGADAEEIRANVVKLRRHGVFYVTVAHLFWRHVATNAPALPFLTDDQYNRLFRQPDCGLSGLGEAAVEAMLDNGIVVDISHMSERALADLEALLEGRADLPPVPIIATHVACRMRGTQHYNLSDETIQMVKLYRGLIGLIFADHQMIDGPGADHTDNLEDTKRVLFAHIDHLRERTGSHEYTAIGSDLDGFIKPTLAGLADMRRMKDLEAALREHYRSDADAILGGNARRVLERALP
jgi:microsomal dipeptidase-like Zn-dependent dipeptidase